MTTMDTAWSVTDLADDLRNELCWTPGLGWRLWDGRVWNGAQQKTGGPVLSAPAQRVNRWMEEHGYQSLAATRLRETVRQLQACLATTEDTFDTHLDLLNVQNGVVNIRTGELGVHDPALRMTKVASVDYDPEARSDAWDQVLAAIQAPELDRLRSRIADTVAGGPLDDVTLIHGPGESGKSTFVQGIRTALGSYALVTGGDVSGLRRPVDMFDLRGARFVVLEDATPRDMDRVKRLATMDWFSVRQMRHDAFVTRRSYRVLVTTNLSPDELTADEGTLRRLHPVEFTAVQQRNPLLNAAVREPETLRAVLRWIVEGALSR